MAKYILSSGFTRPTGSRGGNTFQRNGAGFTIRKRAVPVQKRTARQSHVKNIFASSAQNFRTLSNTQKDTWYDARPEYQRTNSLGVNYTLSAHALQNSSFYNLSNSGNAVINSITPNNPITSPILDFTLINFNFSSLSIVATTNPVPTGYAFNVFISRQLGQLPLTYLVQNTKLIHTFNEGEDMILNIFSEYMAAYSGKPLPDLPFIFFGIQSVQLSTGQKSAIIFYYSSPVV